MNYLGSGKMIINGCDTMDTDVYIKTQRLDIAMIVWEFQTGSQRADIRNQIPMTLHIHSALLLTAKGRSFHSKVRTTTCYINIL